MLVKLELEYLSSCRLNSRSCHYWKDVYLEGLVQKGKIGGVVDDNIL